VPTPLFNAVTVCVDYADELALTLPRNLEDANRVLVVTAPHDTRTPQVVARYQMAKLLVTDVFYRGGARFNKGAAIEEGLAALTPAGWYAVIDADTAMPSSFDWPDLDPQNLYGASRRMLDHLPAMMPPDAAWRQLPLHPQVGELAGFFHLFHIDADVLRDFPWYPTDWIHAGGCDSEFQAKWPAERRVRLPLEVLHVGPSGANWMGRATPYADGTVPPGAAHKVRELRSLVRRRGRGPERFAAEKLPKLDGESPSS
jgi:hypothetical protein